MTLSARALVACLLLLIALLILQLRPAGEAMPLRKRLDTFPASVGTWQAREGTQLDAEMMSLLKVDDYLMQRYVDRDGRTLWLYIGYWATQRKGSQIHSPRNCLPGAGWEPIEASHVTVSLPAPYAPIVVNRYLIQKERSQQVVLYWYQSQGQAVASELSAKIEMVRNSITRNRTDGALIRLSGPVVEGARETTDNLIRYIQAVYPVLGQHLPE